MAVETKVQPLPYGKHEGATIEHVYSRGSRDKFFIRLGGKVYTSDWRACDLAGSYNMNDTIRRAYCRLSGVKFADLKAAIKKERDDESKRDASRAMQRLKAQAARAGYELRMVR